ncbi:helix-turn-helix domain-containing protein [Verminephrobacter aporrectodeae]|uniref:helix-turn-helix domain-containing protein n=1 Tax=Verminephrobacter aporrectodeae TaxID=1110389 RepID=UPI002237B3B2|nr:XRE family transcriptional regulator [Verminephrobacter aporrectodeae]MCW5220761.1 XRE family transcriptional regulator [Verminephrobacter aporrectodeae subsp. tuberculatae]MCW5255287.1 XRE family transcriptional regulator [Verminephrobacter aporrectodeae subsp. tuberculatae]MCW5290056.1 XRE family transcriptional regulator [Verminephrobacter aporrectodeae subsp. tuberculatae]MCW8176944.1 XRE family transcriptional regulator [Verminephrobacter aporrectodeae subsp. tuberculatae]MCW8204422.1 
MDDKVREGNAPSLEDSIGSAIRKLRLRDGLTIAQVAEKADVSRGMLSKIENGHAAAGTDTLARIARALGVSMSMLFSKYDASATEAQHVKKGMGMEVVRRGTKSGHTYHLLAYNQGPVKVFEPFLISMDDDSERYPTFQHPGTEFLYMLEGELEYRCGQQTYLLEPGDSLTFQGEVVHGPERLANFPIRFLSIIIYPRTAD